MHTNLLWEASDHISLENCVVEIDEVENKVSSIVIGVWEGQIFKVEYQIKTNHQWKTLYLDVRAKIGTNTESFVFYGDGSGNWHANGQPLEAFKGCIDVDLPITPFTNTLPVNRLHLAHNENALIKVIYIDILVHEIKPVTQKYTRLSDRKYKYENVPNDFEAVISVDESGFVTDYPGLFNRVSRQDYLQHYFEC